MTDEQYAGIVTLLAEIRDALVTVPEPICEHPEDHRVNLGGLRREEWKCRDCGLHVRNGEVVND